MAREGASSDLLTRFGRKMRQLLPLHQHIAVARQPFNRISEA